MKILLQNTAPCAVFIFCLFIILFQVSETNRLTGAVNAARLEQIQSCESNISQLMAEVELLRSRKVITASYLQARGERRGAGGDADTKVSLLRVQHTLHATCFLCVECPAFWCLHGNSRLHVHGF